MDRAEGLVLDVLKEVMQKEPILITDEVDWLAVYKELEFQSLLPLTYPWIKDRNIQNPDIMDKWKKKYAAQTYRWYSMMEAQNSLLHLLIENKHEVAILKGSANGIYYPNPQLRGSGDIDFLVRWDEYVKIDQLLIENGYHPVGERRKSKHHFEYEKNSITFEMHKRPGGTRIAGKYANQEIINFFQSGLDHIEFHQNGKYEIPTLPKLQNAMVLLLHTAQHMKSGLGLRHILDWMMFAKVNVDDAFWYVDLEPIAKENNVDALAKVMTKMCQKYLGLTSEMTWCQDADDEACDALIEYLFQQGDFGAKAGDEDSKIRVLTDATRFHTFWNRVKESSLYSVPISRKWKVFRPFAWGYQILRYIFKWIKQEHSLDRLADDSEKARERAVLFDKLGIKLD